MPTTVWKPQEINRGLRLLNMRDAHRRYVILVDEKAARIPIMQESFDARVFFLVDEVDLSVLGPKSRIEMAEYLTGSTLYPERNAN